MKELKYKDQKGFENVNTFVQMDQMETQRLHGAKNRYVYDFSFLTDSAYPDNEIFNVAPQYDIFENLSPAGMGSNQALVNQYGFPGDIAEVISVEETAENNRLVPKSWNKYEPTVLENYKTFSINERTMAFVDGVKPSSLGVSRLAAWVDVFRSGYVEFTIKTDKQNCIIASGSQEVDVNDLDALLWIFGADVDQGSSVTSLVKTDNRIQNPPVEIEEKTFINQSATGALFNLDIRLIDGRLAVVYTDKYNVEYSGFTFIGNEIVADNEWHHIVINFGRPGLILDNGIKLNKRNVEIWLDGQLDKAFDELVNEYQIFYPTIKFLFNSPIELINTFFKNADLETDFDYRPSASKTQGQTLTWANDYIGYDEYFKNDSIFVRALQFEESAKNGFKGAMHNFAHGVNIPINKTEIKRRYRLWQGQTWKRHEAFSVSAEMITPVVSTNKKKVIKLYWDDIVDNGYDGVELDKNFVVHTQSVLNKTTNSKTEIFNFDFSNKDVFILENVRVAIKDNVNTLGPGKMSNQNLPASFSQNGRVGNKSAAQFIPKANNSLQTTMYEGNVIADITFSGLRLEKNDRILLTNQIDTSENGIWVFNGLDQMLTRPQDALITDNSKDILVYVESGIYKNSYWKITNAIETLREPQKWIMLTTKNPIFASIDPISSTRWKDFNGQNRFIDINEDINLYDYDLIAFMNYPKNNEEIFMHFPNDPKALVLKQYNDFITSLKIACSNGANLMVTSPKLAEDLGVVREFVKIDQEIEDGDGRSSVVNPFQFDEPADRYFDTHRQNAYHLDTEIPGLTDKETWVLSEAINYIPKDEYDYEQWHLKYSYRQFGLQEGNEFIIPSLPLREVATKDDLPGFRSNARKSTINAVAPNNVLAGTVVTSLANNHYHGSQLTVNEYDDYATTIVVYNGQQLDGMPINGKIFVNCVEDAFTMSREDYNKAVIQVIPNDDPFETNATKQWQYSTSRLNRLPKRIDVKELTPYGQTTATNGGGGPLVQAATNSSNGIIRSETDRGNKDYQSDLYPQEVEEVYPLQEIPVLSMTWLGLQWLAGN